MNKSSEHLSQELNLKLQQRLNPQSVALGRVLEMSVPEFEDEVRRELDENPALDTVDSNDIRESSDFNESSEQLQLADYADPDDAPAYLRKAWNSSVNDEYYDAAALAPDEGSDMGEILLRHLADEKELSDSDMTIAAHIIGNLDSNGYLTRNLADIADDIAINDGFYVELSDIRRVFEEVRALEPAGIGAVDLRDCLLLQLARMRPTVQSITAREIIDKYFDLFSKLHYDRIQAALGIDKEALADAIDLIRTLNPKPASALETGRGGERMEHIVPDFVLDYDVSSDTFTVSLAGNIPELAVETSFRAADVPLKDVEKNDRRSEALAFIKRKRDDATAFIRLVEMRRHTMLGIARAIVAIQHNFFVSGDKSEIKPMILKDISAATGLDLSVISRATAGKYILTPHGVYPLKLFFNERPDAESDVSAHMILKVLSDAIAGEDKKSPLSDRELTALLASKGYDIARRTVAKYRERLGLPVARLRKTL